jgi:hypothetical protein
MTWIIFLRILIFFIKRSIILITKNNGKMIMKKNLLAFMTANAVMLCTGVALAAEFDVSFRNSEGFGVSDEVIQINNIRVDTITANPFDISHPEITSNYYNIPFRFDLSTVHLIPELGDAVIHNETTACAEFVLFINNAFDGSAIENASVTIGNTTQSTNEEGSTTFTNLIEGNNSYTVSASSYTTITQDTTLSCGSINSFGVALNPSSGQEGSIGEGDFRVTLSWGENPRDLDSHLTGPNVANSDDRFHVYYGSRSDGDVAELDVDDTSSYGPETITVTSEEGTDALREGLYRYSVHHYSGSETISSSNAVVNVTLPDGSVRTFTPPSNAIASKDVWTVFELSVTSTGFTLFEVDTIDNSISAGSVRSNESSNHYGSIESDVDWYNLPTK